MKSAISLTTITCISDFKSCTFSWFFPFQKVPTYIHTYKSFIGFGDSYVGNIYKEIFCKDIINIKTTMSNREYK